MDQTTTPTYKYWFWAGAGLMVASMFLVAVGKLTGLVVWVYSLLTVISVVFSTIFILFGIIFITPHIVNVFQLLYAIPRYERWMVFGAFSTFMMITCFIYGSLTIGWWMFGFFTDLYFIDVLREGALVYGLGLIATGIGILLLRKQAIAEDAEEAEGAEKEIA
jgi:hypothetical protein